METGAHLPADRLTAFLSGSLTAGHAAEVEAHIDACEECRVLLSTLVRSERDAAGDPTYQVAAAPVTEGDVVAGKYKVERIIGTGGMGSVVAAWHQQLNQRVALKFMLPSIAADPQAAARFLREGRAAARLSTPHVGRVIDLDSLPNGTPYLVMEFLEGETLAQRLARVGTLTVAEALKVLRQALAGLAEAHAAGIVHRDFKPGNLFHAKRPDGSEVVKVLDFGIAKSVDPGIELGLTRTSSRVLMGSPPYMAPEQINLASIDARTDVWAVGVVLYEMLAGHLPFTGATLVDVMFAIQNKAHAPFDVPMPQAVVEVVDRCLSKRAERRFPDAAAVAEALRDAESSPLVAVPQPARSMRRLPLSSLIAAAAGAVALLATCAWLLRPNPHEHEPQAAVPLMTPPPPHAEPLPLAPSDPPAVEAAAATPAAPVKPPRVRRPPARPAGSNQAAFEDRR